MKKILSNTEADYKVAEVQLRYRPKIKASERPKIRSASNVYEIFMQCWDKDKLQLQEQFKIMLLNCAGSVLGIADISTGGINQTFADLKLIFACALKAACSGILIAHNHPSGNLHPSEADKQITDRIKAGCKLLDIHFLDHIIVTAGGYYSFKDEGLL